MFCGRKFSRGDISAIPRAVYGPHHTLPVQNGYIAGHGLNVDSPLPTSCFVRLEGTSAPFLFRSFRSFVPSLHLIVLSIRPLQLYFFTASAHCLINQCLLLASSRMLVPHT